MVPRHTGYFVGFDLEDADSLKALHQILYMWSTSRLLPSTIPMSQRPVVEALVKAISSSPWISTIIDRYFLSIDPFSSNATFLAAGAILSSNDIPSAGCFYGSYYDQACPAWEYQQPLPNPPVPRSQMLEDNGDCRALRAQHDYSNQAMQLGVDPWESWATLSIGGVEPSGVEINFVNCVEVSNIQATTVSGIKAESALAVCAPYTLPQTEVHKNRNHNQFTIPTKRINYWLKSEKALALELLRQQIGKYERPNWEQLANAYNDRMFNADIVQSMDEELLRHQTKKRLGRARVAPLRTKEALMGTMRGWSEFWEIKKSMKEVFWGLFEFTRWEC